MAKQRRRGGRVTEPKRQRRVLIVEDRTAPLRAQVRATLAADRLTELETRRRELMALDAAMAQAGAAGIDVPAMADRELRARHHPKTGQTVLEVVEAYARAPQTVGADEIEHQVVSQLIQATYPGTRLAEQVGRDDALAELDAAMAEAGAPEA